MTNAFLVAGETTTQPSGFVCAQAKPLCAHSGADARRDYTIPHLLNVAGCGHKRSPGNALTYLAGGGRLGRDSLGEVLLLHGRLLLRRRLSLALRRRRLLRRRLALALGGGRLGCRRLSRGLLALSLRQRLGGRRRRRLRRARRLDDVCARPTPTPPSMLVTYPRSTHAVWRCSTDIWYSGTPVSPV